MLSSDKRATEFRRVLLLWRDRRAHHFQVHDSGALHAHSHAGAAATTCGRWAFATFIDNGFLFTPTDPPHHPTHIALHAERPTHDISCTHCASQAPFALPVLGRKTPETNTNYHRGVHRARPGAPAVAPASRSEHRAAAHPRPQTSLSARVHPAANLRNRLRAKPKTSTRVSLRQPATAHVSQQ